MEGGKNDKLFSNSRMPFRENWKKKVLEKSQRKEKKRIVGFGDGGKMTCEQKCPTLSFICFVML